VTAPARHVWAALAVVYVVWGSTYFGIKIAVETIPPLLAAGSRFLVAALLLAALLAWRRTSLRVTRRELVASLVVGSLLLGLGVGLVHVAETRIDSSVAAMIAGTVPAPGHRPPPARWREPGARDPAQHAHRTRRPAPRRRAGPRRRIDRARSRRDGERLDLVDPRLVRLEAASAPAGSVYEMAGGGALLLLVATAFGEWSDVGSGTFALDSVLAWVYLVVAGSLVGFSAYAWLLKVAPISLVVTHQYVNPLVAIVLGMAFLAERPSIWTLAGAGLIVGAVYVAIRSEFPRGARAARAARAARRGTPADQTA